MNTTRILGLSALALALAIPAAQAEDRAKPEAARLGEHPAVIERHRTAWHEAALGRQSPAASAPGLRQELCFEQELVALQHALLGYHTREGRDDVRRHRNDESIDHANTNKELDQYYEKDQRDRAHCGGSKSPSGKSGDRH